MEELYGCVVNADRKMTLILYMWLTINVLPDNVWKPDG